MIAAVVTVAIPSYLLGQPAAPSAWIDSASQASRSGLGRRCNEAERKGTRPAERSDFIFIKHLHLCWGYSPALRSVGSCRSYGG